ncbi:MAG: DGQHR domain-containing protein [Bacteroidia bacterium]
MINNNNNLTRLKSSWTKYDSVKVIEIIGDDKLSLYLSNKEAIDNPIFKSFLGVKDIKDTIPYYWERIQKYPKQKRLFALISAIFTHYENIKLFAEEFSTKNMLGEFKIGTGGKHLTNLRSALVVSGAAKNSDRRKDIVPYDLSNLFEEGEIGLYFKDLLIQRLESIGYSKNYLQENFLSVCYEFNFHSAISLSADQFERWISGKKITRVKEFDYDLSKLVPNNKIPVFKTHQWLNDWDDIDFSQPMRRKPEPYFYIFNMDIRLLKHLSDIHRRKAIKRRSEDKAVQRNLDEKRSDEIKKFVQRGFPMSILNNKTIDSLTNENLKMPGILPTAIVANIIGPGEKRGNNQIREEDLIKIENNSSEFPQLLIPENVFEKDWDPDLKPIEIIDGQHRLMAFDETEDISGNYQVPVVAYYNLDRTWQAYLFYVINIKPKKINTSLGYDLYPLLRTQNWLENTKDGLSVYRETRAQELVEALWLYEQSPWYNRINMLGQNEGGNISQAAFIRALADTYLRKNSKSPISGLFADVLSQKNHEEIRWVRAQQASFLILLWEQIALYASNSEEKWAISLKSESTAEIYVDSTESKNASLKINNAFLSKNSMLSRDQGVTGISMFTNDIFFIAANYFNDYDFNEIEWEGAIDEKQIETESIDISIELFRNSSLHGFIKDVSMELTHFDWRTSTAIFEESDFQKELSKKYKGSGGYREVWRDLLNIFKNSHNPQLSEYSKLLEKLSGI